MFPNISRVETCGCRDSHCPGLIGGVACGWQRAGVLCRFVAVPHRDVRHQFELFLLFQ